MEPGVDTIEPQAPAATAPAVPTPPPTAPTSAPRTGITGFFDRLTGAFVDVAMTPARRAAIEVYRQAGTLRESSPGVPDMDATIKANPIDTNLNAFSAAMADNPGAQRIIATIRRHPELMQGLDAVLKDEGAAAVEGLQRMLGGQNGQGGIDPAQFETMMNNPAQRRMMAQMMRYVGSPRAGMDYAERFVGAGLAAAQDPAAHGRRFLEVAREGGIETGEVQNQAMMDAFRDIFRNPEQAVNRLLRQMEPSLAGMPGPWGNMLAGLISLIGNNAGSMASLASDIVRPYAELGSFYGQRLAVLGGEARSAAATPAAAAPTPTGLPGRAEAAPPAQQPAGGTPPAEQPQRAEAAPPPAGIEDAGGQPVDPAVTPTGAEAVVAAAANDDLTNRGKINAGKDLAQCFGNACRGDTPAPPPVAANGLAFAKQGIAAAPSTL